MGRRRLRGVPGFDLRVDAEKAGVPVFVVSLAAFLVSLLYTYVLTNGGAVMGQQMAITSVVITVLLAFFGWYSRFMTARGVFR